MVSLIMEATLDKGQLINFIDSLRNPVHLTQGPPGTGKSYLGVVLVRALMRIRILWMEHNPSVGRPPILVLSYKNHAVDEFLCDLLTAERRVFAGGTQQMIRIGNPGDARLQPHSERSCQRADPAVKRAHQALDQLNDVATACKNLSKHALLFGSFRADMFQLHGPTPPSGAPEEDLQKKQNRVAYEATEVLLASVVRSKKLSSLVVDGGSDADDAPTPDEVLMRVTSLLTLDDVNDARCPNTQQLLDRDAIFAELPLLHSGLQHYIDLDPRYDDPAEMLFLFMKGHKPLPRCSYALFDSADGQSHRCPNLATDDAVPLCNEHRCFLFLGPHREVRCGQPVAPGQRYLCAGHACTSNTLCGRPRLGIDGQGKTSELFCEVHCCVKCVQFGIVPACEAQDDPPRNVCFDHPLCCVPECQELALLDTDYCSGHAAPQCQHMHPFGLRCSRPAIARDMDYCYEHFETFVTDGWAWEDAAEVSDASDEDEDEHGFEAMMRSKPKPCAGKNKRGKPCGSPAMPNSLYCHAHAPPAATFTELQKEEVSSVRKQESSMQKEIPAPPKTVSAEAEEVVEPVEPSVQELPQANAENEVLASAARAHSRQVHPASLDTTCGAPSG